MKPSKKKAPTGFREASELALKRTRTGKNLKKFAEDYVPDGESWLLRKLVNDNILTVREKDILQGVICQNLSIKALAKNFDLTPERIIHIFRKGISRLHALNLNQHQWE